jgi:hypothetical protein
MNVITEFEIALSTLDHVFMVHTKPTDLSLYHVMKLWIKSGHEISSSMFSSNINQ